MRCKDCEPHRVYINGKLHCSYWNIPAKPEDSCSIGDRWEKEQKRELRNEECSICGFYSNGCCDDKGGQYVGPGGYCDSFQPKISGCFIVTACVNARNLPNNCDELTTLRDFRDTYVLKLPNGEKEVGIYYRIAPDVVKAINNLYNSQEIYEKIYTNLVIPCTKFVHEERYEEAYTLYKTSTLALAREYLRNYKLQNLLKEV